MNILVLALPLLFVVIAYYFMNNTQKKQSEQRQNFLNNAKVGDRIVTIGGLHGVIARVNEDKKTIDIDCEGILLEFDLTAIKTIKPSEPVEPAITEEVIIEEETETTTSSDESASTNEVEPKESDKE